MIEPPSCLDTHSSIFSFLKLPSVLLLQSDCVLISEPAWHYCLYVVYDGVLLPEYVLQLVFQCLVILFYPSAIIIYDQIYFLATLSLYVLFWFLFLLVQNISLFRQKNNFGRFPRINFLSKSGASYDKAFEFFFNC